jgi:hypothetical protein
LERLTEFKGQLQTVKPYLFHLADQLIQSAPGADWNVLLGDDKGGRLATFFVRRTLAQAGYKIPTFYVAGSHTLHEQFGAAAYEEYFSDIASHLGVASLRPLIVTETTSSGKTIDWLAARLAPVSSRVECATVANKFPNHWTPDYAGGSGRKAAAEAFYAFEARPTHGVVGIMARVARRAQDRLPYSAFTRIPRIPYVGVDGGISSTSLGLGIDCTATRPIVSRLGGNPYTAVAYTEVGALVAEYDALQGQATYDPVATHQEHSMVAV